MKYTETGVLLEGGQSLEVDTIVLATGFTCNIDYVDVPCIKGKIEHPRIEKYLDWYWIDVD